MIIQLGLGHYMYVHVIHRDHDIRFDYIHCILAVRLRLPVLIIIYKVSNSETVNIGFTLKHYMLKTLLKIEDDICWAKSMDFPVDCTA